MSGDNILKQSIKVSFRGRSMGGRSGDSETLLSWSRRFIVLVSQLSRWARSRHETSSNGDIFRVTGHLCGDRFPHKGQWRRALMFSLICAWINGWINNRGSEGLSLHWASCSTDDRQPNAYWQHPTLWGPPGQTDYTWRGCTYSLWFCLCL